MTNGNYVNGPTPIVQQVDHPVIAKANAPEILPTLEFLTSGRFGWVANDSIFGKSRSTNWGGNFSNSLRAERLKVTAYSATEFSRTDQASLDRGQRLAWFMRAPTRQQNVVKILPHGGMFLQVNDHRSFLASVIDNELDSTHACTVRTDHRDVNHRRDYPRSLRRHVRQ